MSDLHITGTLVWYSAICEREVWLMAHQIEPERDNDLLAEGRLVGATAYQRKGAEVTLPQGVRVDRISRRGGTLILHEVKKSSRFIAAASLQLAYYLWLLAADGVAAEGELAVPDERLCVNVVLDETRRAQVEEALARIRAIAEQAHPPAARFIRYCPSCAYAEFCWSGHDVEDDE